jgi:hypothetical protein
MARLPEATVAAKYVIKTHYIMRVIEFHPETQTVDLIQDVFEMTNSPFGNLVYRNEFGNNVACLPKSPDVLYDVPVKQLRWGQFEIQACPVEGDTGYIEVFVDDIQDWIKNGSRSIPWSQDKFVKKNCVFVPFIPNSKNASTTYPTDNTQLVIRSKNASIAFTDSAPEGEEPVVNITTTAKTININAEEGISVNGDVNVTGAFTATGDIVAGKGTSNEISLLAHTHSIPVSSVVVAATGATVNTQPIKTTKSEGK